MPENDPPHSHINRERLAEIEEDLVQKIEEKIDKRADLKKLEDQANAEVENPPPRSGTIEQTLLIVAAGLLIFSLPFIHVFFAIILAAFTIIISLVAGFTSSKETFSPKLNLTVSLVGLIVFEYAAIGSHELSGSSFWFYQLLAFIFLLCTYFSARTFKKH